jgi:hypothetical protein
MRLFYDDNNVVVSRMTLLVQSSNPHTSAICVPVTHILVHTASKSTCSNLVTHFVSKIKYKLLVDISSRIF